MTMKRYAVIIEPTSTGFSAYSPDVSGCAAVGDTIEETRASFQEALELHFDAMRLIGEPIPEPGCWRGLRRSSGRLTFLERPPEVVQESPHSQADALARAGLSAV